MGRAGRRVRVSAAVLFLLLATIGLVQQQPDRRLSPTTYGTGPHGYKATYDLLQESGLAVARNLERLSALPEHAAVWFIAPRTLCGSDPDSPWPGLEWLRGGGTAVVFLAPHQECDPIAGEALPRRDDSAPPQRGGGSGRERAEGTVLEGPLVPRPRTLALPDLVLFDEAAFPPPQSGGGSGKGRIDADASEDAPSPALPLSAGEGVTSWTPVAFAASSPPRPFALEKPVGEGRLIVVADARFLSNSWLDRADSAPLAMDFARAHGTPLLDERDHGFRVSDSALAYLASSAALPVFAALALLGLAFVWWGAALSPPLASGSEPPAPTLASYVDSLATIYARAGDDAGTAQRYREYAVSQLRRRLALPPDASMETVLARLERRPGISRDDLGLLRQPPQVASRADLRLLARTLDEILRKASR